MENLPKNETEEKREKKLVAWSEKRGFSGDWEKLSTGYLNDVGLNWDKLKNKKILEIGARYADLADVAKTKGIDIISIERNPEALPNDHWGGQEISDDLQYVKGDIYHLPFKKESFDIIISRAAPPIVPTLEVRQGKSIFREIDSGRLKKIIEEINGVLKKNGKFHFGPIKPEYLEWFRKNIPGLQISKINGSALGKNREVYWGLLEKE